MKRYALFPLFTLALTACGGGGDSSNTTTSSSAMSVEGKIEQVSGSTITVNTHSYDVSSLAYQGKPLDSNMLVPNMMVALHTNARANNSASVELDPTFTGKITNIDRLQGTFNVSGVPLTFIRLSPTIQNGDWVMVSTLPTANMGYKVLSVVGFEYDANGMAEAEGRVTNVNFENNTFKLGNSLTVLFDERLVNNIKKLRNGAWAEVLGSYNESTGQLVAESIKLKTFNTINGKGEIEGVVTWVANDFSRFEVNYRGQFDVVPSTEFDDGSKSQLRTGVTVEVEYVSKNNRTIAKEIEFEDDFDFDFDWDDYEFEYKGYVSDINPVAQSFQLKGKTIFTDSNTDYEDGLSFDALNGINLEVEGVLIGSDHVAREISKD
ncbi:DUF5666 domain-containing protein [Enterovibrio nigricans]|uniref:DUF5666 domain-containing protein n=1 Tax=Enterovibrio nigricans DSM 22720 TaxID=1121868 RepID=A0A1T4V253_9GAMM|nr:DUF5666 domain-containing protein [Enterovibrio nigricans]SKA59015.1 hypothetical protein SAMN02745132_03065 [Enterovibrio nigricans DSM 22720]